MPDEDRPQVDAIQTLQHYSNTALLFNADAPDVIKTQNPDGSEGEIRKARSWRKMIFESLQDGNKRSRVEKALNSFFLSKLGTGDVGALLVVSQSDRMPWIRDSRTRLLNLMEAWARPDLICDDYIHRINTRRNGSVYASNINPEASSTLIPEISSVYDEKTNTLGFWGDKRSATFVGSSITRKQRGIDLLRNEVEAEMLAIRRGKNKDYIQSMEQKIFVPPAVPLVGGLLQRITTNTDTAGGGDITETLMEVNLAKIDGFVGNSGQKALLTNRKQIRVFRDMEVDRYGGTSDMDYYNFDEMIREKLAAFRIKPDRFYDSANDGIVPCIEEIDLATGVSIALTLDPEYMPLEARFQLDMMFGPWTFVRPVEDLRELVIVMDGATIDDPAEETCFVISDHL